MQAGRHFEDVQVGEGWVTPTLSVGEAEMVGFAREWDLHPFHVDPVAAQDSVFGRLCASGLHTLLLTYRLFRGLRLFEGTTLAGLGLDSLRFHAPVFPGDTLQVEVTVADAAATRTPDRGRLTLRMVTLNQAGEPVLEFLLTFLVKRRPQPAA